jgi:hypothetical protein
MRTTGTTASTDIDRLNNVGSNPSFPYADGGTLADTLRRVLANANVSAYGTQTTAGAAIVLGPAVDADAGVVADTVNTRLADFEVVEEVTVHDVTLNVTFVWTASMAAAKAKKIAADGTTTFVAAAGVTVSGRNVTLGTAIAANNSVLHYVIRGR